MGPNHGGIARRSTTSKQGPAACARAPISLARTALCAALFAVPEVAAAQEAHPNWVATRYEAAFFDDGSESWHAASLEGGARRPALTPLVRVNWASRLGNANYQIEGDVYPAAPGLGYAYVSAGWSPGLPFPELRLAAELFAALPAGFEASAGAIYMDFDENAVTILVASLSRYAGNNWVALRPSWALDNDDLAGSLIVRRWLRTPGEFATLRLFLGSTPEEIATRGTRLESFGAHLDAQLELSYRWAVLPALGVTREERSDVGLTEGAANRMRFTVGVGGMYRF